MRLALSSIGIAILAATVPITSTAAPLQTFSAASSTPRAGSATDYTFSVQIAMPDGSKPIGARSFTIKPPAGLKMDFRPFGKCDEGLLRATASCPSDSQVGRGGGSVRLDGGGIGTLNVSFDGFSGESCAAGAIGCVYLFGLEPTTGTQAEVTVNIHKEGGNQLVFVAPDAQLPTVLSFEPVFTYITGTYGARQGRRSFITNSPKCPRAGWASKLTVNYVDGSTVASESRQRCKRAGRDKRSRRHRGAPLPARVGSASAVTRD